MRKKSYQKHKNTLKAKTILTGILVISILGILSYRSYSKTRLACANTISCTQSLELKVENDAVGIFDGKKVIPPKIDLSEKEIATAVLGDSQTQEEKHIYVDLTNQTVSAYQGNTLFMQAPISSGKWFPTPPGEYAIWEKLKATRMSGGQGADYYNLPNVPYVMFFSGPNADAGRGFSLHGTYWHNNFGHPMSHGCVNMRTLDAKKLYEWANPSTIGNVTIADSGNPGTKITIYGKAP